MINGECHGCKTSMKFKAEPVVLTEMTGETITHYGKDSAAWICSVCRLVPAKLKAARLASGMPEKPTMPSEFDDGEF